MAKCINWPLVIFSDLELEQKKTGDTILTKLPNDQIFFTKKHMSTPCITEPKYQWGP